MDMKNNKKYDYIFKHWGSPFLLYSTII